MLVCPLCSAQFGDDQVHCPDDGRRLLSLAAIESAQGDSMLGTTVADRYVVVGRVGAGGMGTVYRAEQVGMHREVALKVLRRDLGRDPETSARFHREARTLSQLRHRNTVTVFDFGQTKDGLLFLAMELLEGEMLSAKIKREGPLDVLYAIRVALGVLGSLDEAHNQAIIHRDLKPDNIFLALAPSSRESEREIVKVVDFGIAKIRDGERGLDALQTQEGTVFGTPRYMSPEQAQGKPIDGRSDLYAIGVLLFHMLTGHPPFTDDDAVIVMAHHIKTVPTLVRQEVPERLIPESLEALVAGALSKDPDKRPQTAHEFSLLLQACIDDAQNLSSKTIVTSKNHPSSARRSQRALVAVLVGVASFALAVGLWTLRNERTASIERNRSLQSPVAASAVVPALPSASSPTLNQQPVTPEPPLTPEVAPTGPDLAVQASSGASGAAVARPHRGNRSTQARTPENSGTNSAVSIRRTHGTQVVTRWND
ncbi:MAG: serine/threonine-protein kinase [Deltaproteobacteria bacterium]|nr:serine/threonine-protein kinase [Deltaproteobacteria bacterium]